VLSSGELLRLGSSRALRVDVRVISATNAVLKEAIQAGRFREDLFFRLNVIELVLLGLQHRRDDILPLTRYFLASFAEGQKTQPRILSPRAEQALLDHPWSGNVRELENRLHRAMLVSAETEISAQDLDLGCGLPEKTDDRPAVILSEDECKERQAIVAALSKTRGVVAHAAELLGVSRQTLYRKMTRFGIELERRPVES
jgi:DNA-binding NtrC family response regulator